MYSASELIRKRFSTRTLFLCLALLSWTIAWNIGDDCPTTIVSHIKYGSGWDGDLPAVYKALITCPNITSLDLTIEQGGCVMMGEPWNFHIIPGDKIAPLRELRLSGYVFDDYTGYHWDHGRWETGIWRWEYNAKDVLTGDEPSELVKVFPERIGPEPMWESYKGRHAIQWLKAMDWSRLEILDITNPSMSFLTTMTNQVPALKKLKLSQTRDEGDSQYRDALFNFVRSAGGGTLESLSILGHNSLTLEGVSTPLSALGSLHSLEISWWAAQNSFWNEAHQAGSGISAPQISELANALPHLEKLSIGMNQRTNDDSLSQVLDALSSLQTVRLIELNVPPSIQKCHPEWLAQEFGQGRSYRAVLFCNIDHTGYPPRTSDRIAAAEELFAELRDRKQLGAEKLLRLQIRSGAPHSGYATDTISCDIEGELESKKADKGGLCYDTTRVIGNPALRTKYWLPKSEYYKGRWKILGLFDPPLTIDAE